MDCKTSLTSFIVFLYLILLSHAQLSPTFYDTTCPNAMATIRTSIRQAVSRERRMAASIIRLLFHDCFVQGCDASILLDETATIQSEKSAFPNAGSVRGFEVIEDAKRRVEGICPGVVSCADILAVAARDASVAVGGPSWTVRLGRRDSTTANRAEANTDLPPGSSDINRLITNFTNKGLSTRDMVALSGSHTIGLARCATFRTRIYSNSSDIDPGFATTRRRQCPPAGGGGNTNLAPLDLVTPNSFDNNYFRNLQQRRGLLQSDQNLLSTELTANIVNEYIRSPQRFASDFASAMVSMSEISPRLGSDGIIRRVCSAIN